MKNFKIPLSIKVFVLLFIIGSIMSLFTSLTDFYNENVNSTMGYKALEQNQITTYDNYYLTFKENNSNITINSKETFLQVTNIIMSARKDGKNLAWKWCQENQQIPYSEFTYFYKELSTFITKRFEENNIIERNKQTVVKNQNILISTFPGIVYNIIFKIKPLEYKKGFVSEETKELFE